MRRTIPVVVMIGAMAGPAAAESKDHQPSPNFTAGFKAYGEAGTPPNTKKALAAFKKGCEAGEASSCVSAGLLVHYGDGVPIDVRSAHQLLGRGCEAGSSLACLWFGNYQRKGIAVARNPDGAHKAYLRACELGSAYTCTMISKFYEDGRSVEDRRTTAEFERLACGKSKDCNKSGHQLDEEEKAQLETSLNTWKMECSRGDAAQCANAGIALYRTGRTDSQQEALPILKLGCEGGSAAACTQLAYAHYHGKGGGSQELAAPTAVRACDLNSADGCTLAATLAKRASAPAARVISMYRKGCFLGDGEACGKGGDLLEGAKADHDALVMFEHGCDLEDNWSCNQRRFRRLDLERFTSTCRAGVPDACEALGGLYEEGKTVDKSAATARQWYRQGCDLGHAGSCASLAWMMGTAKDNEAERAPALDLARKSCDAGSGFGCTVLGIFLDSKFAGERDQAGAAQSFAKACELGWSQGCNLAGQALSSGAGVPQDNAQARTLWKRGCALGAKESCNRFESSVDAEKTFRGEVQDCDKKDDASKCFYAASSLDGGEYVDKNPAEERRLMLKACNSKGDSAERYGPQACYHVALAAIPTQSPDRAKLKTSCDRGFETACKAINCLDGNAERCAQVGEVHLKPRGHETSPEAAEYFMTSACDRGGKDMCFVIGRLYAAGSWTRDRLDFGGREHRDGARALAFFDKACTAGHPEACFRAGDLLAKGELVARDAAGAQTRITKACDAGFGDACLALKTAVAASAAPATKSSTASTDTAPECIGAGKIVAIGTAVGRVGSSLYDVVLDSSLTPGLHSVLETNKSLKAQERFMMCVRRGKYRPVTLVDGSKDKVQLWQETVPTQ